MRPRILVTGGAGFIGSHVVENCVAAGYEVVVLDDLSSGKNENLPTEALLYQVDIVDGDAVRKVFESFRPAHVIHLAAQISVGRSVREPNFDAKVNILGLLNVLESTVHSSARSLIFSSSGGVLYGDVEEPVDEDHRICPISPYGIAKYSGEQYLRFFSAQHGLKCTALRYGNVYGPRQDPYGEAGVVAIFLKRLLQGQAPIINGDGKSVRDYVYVQDVAEANLLVLQDDRDGFNAYNVGTGIRTDVTQLEEMIRYSLLNMFSELGITPRLPDPVHGPPRLGDLRSSLLSARRIGEELGWTPQVTLEEGLRRTVAWFSAAKAPLL